jgi:hypothetical protein
MSDNVYFSIGIGTPADGIVQQWHASRSAHLLAHDAFMSAEGVPASARAQTSHSGTVVGYCAPLGMTQRDFREKLGEAWRSDPKLDGAFVPRKTKPFDELNRRFKSIPDPLSTGWLKAHLTGMHGFDDWCVGMRVHGIGIQFREGSGCLVVLDYDIWKKPAFTPAAGMVLCPDQFAAMAAWRERHSGDEDG